MKRRKRNLKKMTIWVLTAVLAATMCMPVSAFADDVPDTEASGLEAVEPATEQPATEQPAEAPEMQAAEAEDDAVILAQEEDPDMTDVLEPTKPEYRSIYRVETKDKKLRCYWYDESGNKDKDPQKKAYFFVKFDKNSKTDGTADKSIKKAGKLYYFDKKGKGALYTGWFKQKKKKYYFRKGKRLTGVKKIKGRWYSFSKKDGKLVRKIGDGVDKKIQKYSSKRKYMIIVKLSERKVRIYKGRKNNWNRIRTCKCTIGARGTPTVRGTFTIKSRGLYFNTGISLRCWYYTQFYGNYLFHSVLYDRSSRPVHVMDGRLGIRASHGCIRLSLKSAKWIYRNIPSGTKVIIY